MLIWIYWKGCLRDWGKQLWALIFAIGLPCLAQPIQPPLGATPQEAGTTFRLWVLFVDLVAVKVNNREPAAMTKEGGDAEDDTVWVVNIPGAKVGDRYKYFINSNGVTLIFSRSSVTLS